MCVSQLDAKYNITGKVSNGLSSGFARLSKAVNKKSGVEAPRGAGEDVEDSQEVEGQVVEEEATTTAAQNPYKNF